MRQNAVNQVMHGNFCAVMQLEEKVQVGMEVCLPEPGEVIRELD